MFSAKVKMFLYIFLASGIS